MSPSRKVLFLYLGRRGALGRFTLELAREAQRFPGIESIVAVSKMSENIGDFAAMGDSVMAIDTFTRVLSFANVRNFLTARRRLLKRILEDKVSVVVTLMPHI